MIVSVIGLGLIGGSMAIDLKKRGFADRVLGVENDPVNAAAAEKIGLVDEVVGFDDAVSRGDIVIIAVPVG
ncbi:MAG: prephenate dehydrogenase/arogenate dehydrogenase family protein, partial [Candidatus Cryptobacteroides sp.]